MLLETLCTCKALVLRVFTTRSPTTPRNTRGSKTRFGRPVRRNAGGRVYYVRTFLSAPQAERACMQMQDVHACRRFPSRKHVMASGPILTPIIFPCCRLVSGARACSRRARTFAARGASAGCCWIDPAAGAAALAWVRRRGFRRRRRVGRRTGRRSRLSRTNGACR